MVSLIYNHNLFRVTTDVSKLIALGIMSTILMD